MQLLIFQCSIGFYYLLLMSSMPSQGYTKEWTSTYPPFLARSALYVIKELTSIPFPLNKGNILYTAVHFA